MFEHSANKGFPGSSFVVDSPDEILPFRGGRFYHQQTKKPSAVLYEKWNELEGIQQLSDTNETEMLTTSTDSEKRIRA